MIISRAFKGLVHLETVETIWLRGAHRAEIGPRLTQAGRIANFLAVLARQEFELVEARASTLHPAV